MVDDTTRVNAAIVARTEELRAYAGSAQTRALIGLLDALAEAYMLDLAETTQENLPRPQNALRQVRSLKAALLDPNGRLSPQI